MQSPTSKGRPETPAAAPETRMKAVSGSVCMTVGSMLYSYTRWLVSVLFSDSARDQLFISWLESEIAVEYDWVLLELSARDELCPELPP